MLEIINKFSKKQKIITASSIAAIIIMVIAGSIYFGRADNAKDKLIENNDISIEGDLGNAISLDSKEISKSSFEYQNVEEKIKDDTLVSLYITDITIYDHNQKRVQPNGDVKITMDLPDRFISGDDYEYDKSKDEYKVYRTEADNSVTELESEVDLENNKIVFTTSHFSVYSVAKYNKDKCVLKTDNIDEFVTELNKKMYANDNIVVYDGPNSTWNPIGAFQKDQEIEVVGQYQENNWYKVRLTDDTFGYVDPGLLSEQKPEENSNNTDTTAPATDDSNKDNSGSNDSGNNNGNPAGSGTGKSDGNKGGHSGGNTGGNTGGNSNGNNSGKDHSQPAQPVDNNKGTNTSQENNDMQIEHGDKCPYPLLTWTTYQGHYGFFVADGQSGESMGMQLELAQKYNLTSLNSINLYFKDTGAIQFMYAV